MRRFFILTHSLRQLLKRVVDLIHHVENAAVPERWRWFYRFLISGAPSQVAFYSFYVPLPQFGVHYLVASGIAFTAYLLVNFVLMRRWVFGSQGHPLVERLGHFLVHLTAQAVTMLGLYILVNFFAWWYVAAQVPMTMVYFSINLFLSRFVFDPKDSE